MFRTIFVSFKRFPHLPLAIIQALLVFLSFEPCSFSLHVPVRKPKALAIGKGVTKISDLKPMLLATSLARIHPAVTELQLMQAGGECYEMRRKALQDFKMSDTSESLNIRLALAQQLQKSEKVWKKRLLLIAKEGEVVVKTWVFHGCFKVFLCCPCPPICF